MPALPKNASPTVKTPADQLPAAAKKPPTPEPVIVPVEEVERAVIYPKVSVSICSGDAALTDAQAKELLGWEDEFDYQARMKAEHPKLKKAADFGEDYLLKDVAGRKVRCWNNSRNRPFDLPHCMELCQDILEGKWEFNLENIIISLTGLVTSGQHRLIALVMACQRWASQKEGAQWKQRWKTRPTIETTVAFGGSEKPEVIRTLDNVKPRSLEDVFYTSELYRDLGNAERKECSRMLDFSVDFMWKRTEVKTSGPHTLRYQTHSSSIDFANAHPKLQTECIGEMFRLNKDRVISKMRLSAGHCAALLYLMGSSTTDPDESRYLEQRNEKVLNWDNWDKALEYWHAIIDLTHPVRKALGDLQDSEDGLGGRLNEKVAIIIKGWHAFIAGGEITEADLKLDYGEDRNGNTKLMDKVTCGGIDFGGFETEPQADPEVSPEEAEAAAKAEREEKAKATIARIEAKKKPAPAPNGELTLSDEDKKLIEERRKKAENVKPAAKPVKRSAVPLKTPKP